MSKRNKYNWASLVAIGDSFTLTEADGPGLRFARQLVFARNSTCKRQGLADRYKCEKVDGGMRVSRVA